jgi:Na+/melibiose symporter-like transporter
MPRNLAGAVILAGQIADAAATPIAGRLSDKTPTRFGRRKLWLLIGAVIVNGSFYFIFAECNVCTKIAWLPPVVWYSLFASLFNVGWATLQVAHMALIPDLTSNDGERTRLNSARYAGCIVATLLMLLITTLCFTFLGLSQKAFRIACFAAIGTGDLFTIAFLLGVKEPKEPRIQRATTDILTSKKKGAKKPGDTASEEEEARVYRWYEWFRFPAMYQIGVVYMCARAAGNLSQVYLPFYIQHVLDVKKSHVLAEVPAVLMGVSFVFTFALRAMNKALGRLLTFLLGTIVMGGACAAMIFIPP